MTKGGLQLPTAPPPELAEDEKSLGEAIGLATGIDLSSQEELNKLTELVNRGKVNKHIHRCAVIGIYLVAISAAIMFITLVLHYLKPELWLLKDQVSSLQSFLFSGGMGAVLAGVGKKVFGAEKAS